MITSIVLAVHLFLCTVLLLLACFGKLRLPRALLPMMILVPFWGVACVLMLAWERRKGQAVPLDYDRLEMTDEIYSAISVGKASEGREMVPVEEALLLDSAQQCREMVLDMLLDDPNRYLSQLKTIGSADDVEVVHYAATVMTEIGKQYESQWQKLNRAYSDHPEDEQALENCCVFLKEYLAAELQQGYARQVLHKRYLELLEIRFARKPQRDWGVELAESLMSSGNFTRAREILDMLTARWPEDGSVWMTVLRYYIRQKQGERIQETISYMEEKNIMLSAHEREMLAFWRN